MNSYDALRARVAELEKALEEVGHLKDGAMETMHNAVDHMKAREDQILRLKDALQLMIDYVGDGTPEGAYGYCMTEARAALKGLSVLSRAERI